MTVTSKPLITAKYASNAETSEYTAAAGTRTIIDKFTGYSSAGGTLTVKLIPSGGSAAATNVMVVKTLTAGETYTFPEIVGHALEAGGIISVLCSAATNTVIRATGREVT